MALVAALFVAGNVQAQSTVYATYSPESFISGNTCTDYQGFSIGFTQNTALYKGFGVFVGAQFRMNMNSASKTMLGMTGTVKETQTIIDVPVLLNYKVKANHDLSIFPFAGPMLSLALTGVTKGTDPVFGGNKVNWYDDKSTQSRFNLYVVFGADVKYKNLNLFGGYRLGLLDLDKSDNATLKTNGLIIGLGYTL